MTDKVQKILNEIATRKLCTMDEHMAFYNDKAKEDYRFLSEIEELIKALQQEPVSEDLEEEASRYAKEEYSHKSPATLPNRCIGCYAPLMYAFKAGANWKEQQMMAKAIDATVSFGKSLTIPWLGCTLDKMDLKQKDKVKVIVIKED